MHLLYLTYSTSLPTRRLPLPFRRLHDLDVSRSLTPVSRSPRGLVIQPARTWGLSTRSLDLTALSVALC